MDPAPEISADAPRFEASEGDSAAAAEPEPSRPAAGRFDVCAGRRAGLPGEPA